MARAISICIVLIFCFLGTLARAAPEKKNLVDSFADSAFILTGQCFDAESCKKDCQKGPGPPDPECVKKCETPPCEPNDKKCLDGVCDQRCHNEAEYNQPGIVSEYNQPEIPTYAKQLSGECNRGGTGRCGCFGSANKVPNKARTVQACQAIVDCNVGRPLEGCDSKAQLPRDKDNLCYCPKTCAENNQGGSGSGSGNGGG
ncbi:hypothetical protein IWZ01DRAFT_558044 [Phyllosticta capitalensis]|uniref:Uncharacterized protein n=1 Tax=Phyllosticta capitalensis TaxID=121624 RepID=A0ABR1YE98_9PEZI